MKSIFVLLLVISSSLCFSQAKTDPLQHAQALKDSGQYEEAFKEVNLLINRDSSVADYFDFRADLYFQMRLFEDAKSDYDKAVALAPNDPLCYHYRSNFYLSMQQPDLAIEDNNRALALVKNDTLKYAIVLNRGACYSMKRDFQKAYDDYLTVLNFDSTSQTALTDMGTVLDELGRRDESIAYLEKVVRLYPDFVGGYGNLAFQFTEMGQYQKALDYNNKVLELDPKEPFGYNNRGYVKYKMNDLKGAMQDVNHSLELYPENSYAYRNRALIFIALKQFSFACTDLKKAIALGFTAMYGDEVQKLLDKYCTNTN